MDERTFAKQRDLSDINIQSIFVPQEYIRDDVFVQTVQQIYKLCKKEYDLKLRETLADIEIKQIAVSEGDGVFGLGVDSKVYWWNKYKNEWSLYT